MRNNSIPSKDLPWDPRYQRFYHLPITPPWGITPIGCYAYYAQASNTRTTVRNTLKPYPSHSRGNKGPIYHTADLAVQIHIIPLFLRLILALLLCCLLLKYAETVPCQDLCMSCCSLSLLCAWMFLVIQGQLKWLCLEMPFPAIIWKPRSYLLPSLMSHPPCISFLCNILKLLNCLMFLGYISSKWKI
jgi:hypothetical protein